jgi:hypothetical protein
MGFVVACLLSGFVSFLPRGWRDWFAPDEELSRPAAVTGIVQYAACAAVLLTRLIAYLQANIGAVGASAVARDQQITLSQAQYDLGFFVSTGYFFRPLTALLFYLTCEGLARFLAAAVTHEVLGTAPLYLLRRLCRACLGLRWPGLKRGAPKPKKPRRAARNSTYCPLQLRPWNRHPSDGGVLPHRIGGGQA